MKKYLIALLLIFTMTVSSFLLVGCDGTEPAETDAATESEQTEPETEPETEPAEVKLTEHTIIDGGIPKYALVRPDVLDESAVQKITLIFQFLRENSNDVVEFYTDMNMDYLATGKHDEDKLEIVIGLTNYEGSSELSNGLGYGSYSIDVIGNKIYIVANSEEILSEAISDFYGILCDKMDYNTKTLVLKNEDFVGKKTVNEKVEVVPAYDDARIVGVYDCGDECDMIILDDTTREGFDLYSDKLEEFGFKEYSTSEMNNNRFATFTKDEYIVNLMFTFVDKETRVLVETTETNTLYPIKDEYEKVCDSMLIQIGVTPSASNEAQNGMSYLVRLEDGSFIVFDGGFANSNSGLDAKRENARHLYETLVKYTPEGKKPTIKMWMITHLHSDHYGAFNSFSASYGEKLVNVEYFIVNFPASDQMEAIGAKVGTGANIISKMKSAYPSSTIIKAYAGQVMQFANVKLEMLYSLELYAPATLNHMNTASLICKLYIGDQTFLMLADSYYDTTDILCKVYGSYLQSDIVQVAHHGAQGGSDRLYRLIDPTWVLWPAGQGRSQAYYEADRHDYLRSSPKVQKIFFAHWNIAALNFPFDGTNYTEEKIS